MLGNIYDREPIGSFEKAEESDGIFLRESLSKIGEIRKGLLKQLHTNWLESSGAFYNHERFNSSISLLNNLVNDLTEISTYEKSYLEGAEFFCFIFSLLLKVLRSFPDSNRAIEILTSSIWSA